MTGIPVIGSNAIKLFANQAKKETTPGIFAVRFGPCDAEP